MNIHYISPSFHPHWATDRLRKIKDEEVVWRGGGGGGALRIFGCGCAAETLEPLILSIIILSIGPAPWIESITTRSSVKRSTDWANPAAVKMS